MTGSIYIYIYNSLPQKYWYLLELKSSYICLWITRPQFMTKKSRRCRFPSVYCKTMWNQLMRRANLIVLWVQSSLLIRLDQIQTRCRRSCSNPEWSILYFVHVFTTGYKFLPDYHLNKNKTKNSLFIMLIKMLFLND